MATPPQGGVPPAPESNCLSTKYRYPNWRICAKIGEWQWNGDHYWEEEESEWKTWTGPHNAVCDTTTGQPLDMRKVKVGRNEELEWMRKMQVWDRVPRHEAAQGGY